MCCFEAANKGMLEEAMFLFCKVDAPTSLTNGAADNCIILLCGSFYICVACCHFVHFSNLVHSCARISHVNQKEG